MNCCNKENNVKQGTSFELSVNFSGEEFSLDDVSSINFVFKQNRSKTDEIKKSAVWKSDGSGDCRRITGTNIIMVPFSDTETYLFASRTAFYMDTLIIMTGSENNPMTNIVELMMQETLFGEVENV